MPGNARRTRSQSPSGAAPCTSRALSPSWTIDARGFARPADTSRVHEHSSSPNPAHAFSPKWAGAICPPSRTAANWTSDTGIGLARYRAPIEFPYFAQRTQPWQLEDTWLPLSETGRLLTLGGFTAEMRPERSPPAPSHVPFETRPVAHESWMKTPRFQVPPARVICLDRRVAPAFVTSCSGRSLRPSRGQCVAAAVRDWLPLHDRRLLLP